MEENFFYKALNRIFREVKGFRNQSGTRQSLERKRNRRMFVATLVVLLVTSTGIHNLLGTVLSWIAVLALLVQIGLYAQRGWERVRLLDSTPAKSAITSLLSGQPTGSGVVEPPPPLNSHDIARVYDLNGPSLPQRGFKVDMPISIGRNLGITEGRAWFPHAAILGATGSGKTFMLRPFIGRWTRGGPVCAMSTKGDLIPESLPGTPGTVHLVTPLGRNELDAEGQARLNSLEATGWTIKDCVWDPVAWAAQALNEGAIQRRAGSLARCMAGVVAGDHTQEFWAAAASGLIEAGLIIEAAAISAGATSWRDLIDPSSVQLTNSDILLNTKSKVAEGVSRLFHELQGPQLSAWKSDQELSLTLSATERAAFAEILEMGELLKANNVTALSKYQTMTTALGCYKYPFPPQCSPLDVSAWAGSSNDLMAVIVPSDQNKSWAASMAALAVAVWTEASGNEDLDHLIVLDEVASLAPVPTLHEWIAQGRSLGVHVVAVLQNESQAKLWAGNDTAGWILNTWPLALIAGGTPTYGLAKYLADGEGQHEVEKLSTNEQPSDTFFGNPMPKSTSRSNEMRDRIEPNDVFGEAETGAWRVVDRRVGPWATPIREER